MAADASNTTFDTLERVIRLEGAVGHVRADLHHLQQRAQPKQLHWLSIVTFIVSTVVLVLGSWWGLSEKFAQRPTFENLEKILQVHQDHGHPTVNQQMQLLREAQIEMRAAIESVQGDVRAIKEALRDKKK